MLMMVYLDSLFICFLTYSEANRHIPEVKEKEINL